MKNITIRLNDEDEKVYERIAKEICAESPTPVIRWALKKGNDFLNIENNPIAHAPIGRVNVRIPDPDVEPPIINID